MTYALQARLSFSTATRRDQVVSALNTRIATKPRWGATILAPSTEDGRFYLTVELRFTSQADLDDVYSFLQQQAAQRAGTGRVARHNCRHDETNPAQCQVAAEVVL